MERDNVADHLGAFVRRHNLRASPAVDAENSAIYWLSEANILVNQGYGRCTDGTFEAEPAIGLLLNLLHRAFEHMDAALVAFCTNSGASSEALARVATELSVSVRYILLGQRESRLLAFLQQYANEEDRRLRNWTEAANELQEQLEKEQHLAAIAHRGSGIKVIHEIVSMLRHEFGQRVTLVDERWPSVYSRFEAVGDAPGYRTVYSRMSSQIHSDAEETIRHLMAKTSNDEKLMETMGYETIMFSRFMLFFALKYFLEASAQYAKTYAMADIFENLNRGQREIGRELQVIAQALP